MLFMTVSGEEKGLLGSGFYADHPVFPLEKTTANLNIDMIGRIGSAYMPANDSMYVYVIGSDKISTDLDRLLRQANDETVKLKLDYTYNDNNDPNRFYYRSDHYNFAKNGVPVVFFFTGTHPDYHRPTDTPDKILYERMALIGRLVYSTAWKVATLPEGLAKDVSLSK
jgi:Zn-dependent M28 family amino/carboxypeptidase